MRSWGSRTAGAALALLLGGCVAPGSDIHLEPLYSRHSTADGGVEVEALGGFYVSQDPIPGTRSRIWGLRPLWSTEHQPDGDRVAHFLVPFGFDRESESGHTSMLLPIFYFQSHAEEAQHEGLPEHKHWDLVALPGILWTHSEQGNDRLALFPFAGRVNNLLTYDKIVFVLFPLFLYTEREGVRSWHILWPIFGWSRGEREWSTHVWPLWGHSQRPGTYDRWFWLWPFIHWQRSRAPGEPGLSAYKFLFFPFYGTTKIKTYRSWSVLWPFFGYARDPRGDYWAVDAPWPFVRLQGGGLHPAAEERTRVWPFYSHFKADKLHADSYLWPLIHVRTEDYVESHRDSFYFLPFWQSWTRLDKNNGTQSSWRKLWPLWQSEHDEFGLSRTAFPALNPFQRSSLIDFHYAWLWELYTGQTGPYGERQRLWGGIYRHEKGHAEERTSLSALYASRRFKDGRGSVTERSLLFGLLRWRVSDTDGFQPMVPAIPGPGWPRIGTEPERAGTSQPAGVTP